MDNVTHAVVPPDSGRTYCGRPANCRPSECKNPLVCTQESAHHWDRRWAQCRNYREWALEAAERKEASHRRKRPRTYGEGPR